ncbi:SAM-dependent methyltransferase [Tsukamurella sp. 8F]|uniref:TRM11 family SAM-dependent methyltransferase n=1 Tax=unclassified Tsukamurella TaxID=2633480 RepID=UPI0023B94332|nr:MULTISPECIES: SAM-dependent methyltransferase [unclassified Tsukamurella]MDF0528695.1 SAM-dependent methyltransferase [Tsukamurella sp. 8J]MDF0585657.1 SAM-dependent methyltransferase [Tsukamurella sp. 8F]
MAQYALLPAPSANRVYARSALDLVVAELTVLGAGAFGGRLSSPEVRELAGVEYVLFTADLSAADLALFAHASSVYALFEIAGDLLRPVAVPSPDRYPSDLLTILKYQGKTNEQFTRLLLTVTAASAERPERLTEGRMRLLDPVCGRGTTLNQAAILGLDAVGIDVDGKDFDLYSVFLTTWLKDNRLKHKAATTPVRREHALLAKKYEAVFAPTREAYAAGHTQSVTMYLADTARAAQLIRPGTVDLVVGDLPYGVRHGSSGPKGLARGPLDLLDSAVGGWAATLRTGGAMGLSWNTLVAPRADVAAALDGAGLDVLSGPGYDGFAHRVDRSILRDLMVARKR